jgi:hypothetical protein
MAGKSDFLEQLYINLIFKGTTNAAWASAAGSATQIIVALHSADPMANESTGTQSTSEVAYTSYARLTKNRSTDWTVTGSSVSPAANLDFPQCTGGTATATHFSLGDGTNILYAGAISPTISISNGVIPRLTTATAVTED